MEFQFFERRSATQSSPDDCIQLYMPETASQPNTVSWDTENFGAVGNAMTKTINSPGDFVGNAISLGESALGIGYGNLLSKAASALGGKVSAEAVLGSTRGEIPNPYLTMVFRGVNFRNYSFSFKFFPYSADDSDTIKKIIDKFRENSLPPGKGGAFLGYPKEVEVFYKWKGENNKYLHKFKRSVITGIDVDYTPNGMFAVMRNGMPASIQMNIKLSEIEIVLRDHVKEGY